MDMGLCHIPFTGNNIKMRILILEQIYLNCIEKELIVYDESMFYGFRLYRPSNRNYCR